MRRVIRSRVVESSQTGASADIAFFIKPPSTTKATIPATTRHAAEIFFRSPAHNLAAHRKCVITPAILASSLFLFAKILAYDDTFIPRSDPAAPGLAQRRSGGPRTTDAAGVWGTAPDGASLHAA